MKLSNIYLWHDREWVVVSMSRTTFGVWIGNSLVCRLARDCGTVELGQAVLDSLQASQTDQAHPNDWRVFHLGYLKSLGVRNVNLFEGQSRLVAAAQTGPALTLTPNENRGRGNGFTPLKPGVTLLNPEAAAIGQAVAECSERCR